MEKGNILRNERLLHLAFLQDTGNIIPTVVELRKFMSDRNIDYINWLELKVSELLENEERKKLKK